MADRPDIQVVILGTDTPHPSGFTIDRPSGLPEHLLLRFRTPMEIHTSDGIASADPGDCILYAPGFRQWYRGRRVGFRDDWVHLAGAGIATLVRDLGLPLNRVVRPRSAAFIPRSLAEIAEESTRREAHWQQVVANLVVHLLITFSRQLDGSPATTIRGERAARLRDARRAMLMELTRPWTVAGLARRAGLRQSRFQQAYRALFGVSPIEDLIRARIEHARMLLSSARTTVGDAADASGFASIYHFSRTFRRRVGCPPSDYHRHLGGASSP